MEKAVWLSQLGHWLALSSPEDTEDDDGHRQRDEGHAVTDGVAHFDGVEEFPL